MYTCYISKYKDGDNVITTPVCIYDKRSPALDLRVASPILRLADSSAGSFSFVLPMTHFMYDKIVEKLTEVIVKDDDEVIFEGSVISNEKDWNNNKKIVVEGYAAYLNDSTQPRREFFNVEMKDYISALIAVHNEKSVHKFQVGTVDVLFPEQEARSKRELFPRDPYETKPSTARSSVSLYECTQYESTMSYLLSLKSRCQGHFIFTRVSENLYNIDYLKDLPLANDVQTIALGENLLDYNESNDYQLLCTSVLPIASVSEGVSSEVGDVLGVIPGVGCNGITVGTITIKNSLTSSDVQKDDYVYVQDNQDSYSLTGFPPRDWETNYTDYYILSGGSYIHVPSQSEPPPWQANTYYYFVPACQLFVVEDFDTNNKPIYKFLTSNYYLHLGCRLGKVGTDCIPVYFNDYNKDIRRYRSYADFPPASTGRSDIYYIASTGANSGVYWWNNGSYIQITGDEATRLNNDASFYVMQIANIDKITPEVHQFYVSARNYNYGTVHDYDTKFITATAVQGAYNLVEKEINDTGWTSLLNECIDISYSPEGADNYAATVLYIAGWGGSIPPRICREAYYYRTKDYSVGDAINLTDRSVLMDRTGIFWDGTWDGTNWTWAVGVHTEDRYPEYLKTMRIDVHDIHDAIYISSRQAYYDDDWVSEHDPTKDRNDGPIWWAVDSSGQTLGFKDKEDPPVAHMPSVIYEKIDLSSADLYGAQYVYVTAWGNTDIPVTANYYVPQSGSLHEYLTVETASDYYIKIGEGETGDECLHTTGSLFVESPSLIDIYGRIEKKVEFNNIDSPEMLLEKAVDFLVNSQLGEITRDIQGVDLHNQNVDISPFRISTKIPVWSPVHKCNETFDLVELTITLDNPADSKIGVSKSITIEDRLREASET